MDCRTRPWQRWSTTTLPGRVWVGAGLQAPAWEGGVGLGICGAGPALPLTPGKAAGALARQEALLWRGEAESMAAPLRRGSAGPGSCRAGLSEAAWAEAEGEDGSTGALSSLGLKGGTLGSHQLLKGQVPSEPGAPAASGLVLTLVFNDPGSWPLLPQAFLGVWSRAAPTRGSGQPASALAECRPQQ